MQSVPLNRLCAAVWQRRNSVPVLLGRSDAGDWHGGAGRMFTGELYAKVRHAVMIEGLSRREAAKRFGIHRNTITKMLSFSVPPGYRRRERPASGSLDLLWRGLTPFLKATAAFTRNSVTRRIGFSSGGGTSKGLPAATRSCVSM